MPGASVEQIRAHLRDEHGSVRTRRGVKDALHAIGLGAKTTRVTEQLTLLRGVQRRTPATYNQARAKLRNEDGKLRTNLEVVEALHASGLGASSERIAILLKAARDDAMTLDE